MTPSERYRHEKARAQARLAPLIAEARTILDRVAPIQPFILAKPASDKAYYEANRARLLANQRAARAILDAGRTS
jgi:hypothetical protein